MTRAPDEPDTPDASPPVDLTPAVEEGHAAADAASADDAPPLRPAEIDDAGPLVDDGADEPPSQVGTVFRSGS